MLSTTAQWGTGNAYIPAVTFAEVVAPMIGATVTAVDLTLGSDEGTITTDRGVLRFWHSNDCCESVEINDLIGEPADLIGGVIALVEERDSTGHPGPEHAESYTWTFYEIRTSKGDLTIRWLGESNGYYSEDVDASWTPNPTPEE